MKKVEMMFYAAAVVGFYLAEALLVMDLGSVAGASLILFSVLMLALGVLCQWKASSHSRVFTQDSFADTVKVGVSC